MDKFLDFVSLPLRCVSTCVKKPQKKKNKKKMSKTTREEEEEKEKEEKEKEKRGATIASAPDDEQRDLLRRRLPIVFLAALRKAATDRREKASVARSRKGELNTQKVSSFLKFAARATEMTRTQKRINRGGY